MSLDRVPLEGQADLRWERADVAKPQGTMFDGVQREVGRGEFRGMEFLHVRAQRIINQLKGGPGYLPFQYTINAYRGCSHACSYCASGETPILMADGRTKPLADVRPGDMVYGTVRRGSYRRYAPTRVLDHWSTTRSAHRVTLADGTELVTSGDHRFLSDRGWKHVANGPGRPRPHLSVADSLLGFGQKDEAPPVGARVETGAHLDVVAVDDLGMEMPMFDITTGTGDFIADGVVSHNCFARPTHEYLGLDIGRDFEQRIVVKVNAAERLRAELKPSRWKGDLIAMGTNTDPYQRCEGKYRLTRSLVEVLAEHRNPFSILTKSTLILRDLELLAAAAKVTDVRVNLSIGTLDDEVWKATEPGTPSPAARLRAVAALNEAGVSCGVLIAPILPGLSDGTAQLEAVAKACVEAGAVSVSTVLLHLRGSVKEHYLGELARTHPHLVERMRAMYPGANAPKADRQRVGRIVHAAVRKAGGLPLDGMTPQHMVGRSSAVPLPTRAAAPVVEQLGLGF